jgi:hypothetical protein
MAIKVVNYIDRNIAVAEKTYLATAIAGQELGCSWKWTVVAWSSAAKPHHWHIHMNMNSPSKDTLWNWAARRAAVDNANMEL